ncbi:unnamed protein product, partial [Vitis vinifera]
MSTTKYDIENFNGRNDFGLWKMKMEAILIQQGITLLSDKVLPESMIEKERQEVQRKAYSSIILSLSDQVMRKVSHEKTIVGILEGVKWFNLSGFLEMILIHGCRIQILDPNHINFGCFALFFLTSGIVFLCFLKLVFDLNLLRNLDKTSTHIIINNLYSYNRA